MQLFSQQSMKLESNIKFSQIDDNFKLQLIEENSIKIQTQIKQEDDKKLRDYQIEMLQNSLNKNVIIYLETGMGKTLITISLIYYYLVKFPDKKIIFLANTIQLVEQQAKQIQQNLPIIQKEVSALTECGLIDLDSILIQIIHGDKNPALENKTKWELILQQTHIFVCIPVVFLSMLRMGIINMQGIQCIIFDECHHTNQDHTFNIIMKEFYFTKISNNVPFIVGTTASPITENKNQDIDTVLSLMKLIINLDANYINFDNRVLNKYNQEGEINLVDFEREFQFKSLENFLKNNAENSSIDMPSLQEKMFNFSPDYETFQNIFIILLEQISELQVNLSSKIQKLIEWLKKQITMLSIKMILELGFYSYYQWLLYIKCEIEENYLLLVQNSIKINDQEVYQLIVEFFINQINNLEKYNDPIESNFSNKFNKLINIIKEQLLKSQDDQYFVIIFVKERLIAKYLQYQLQQYMKGGTIKLKSDYVVGHGGSSKSNQVNDPVIEVQEQQEVMEQCIQLLEKQNNKILNIEPPIQKIQNLFDLTYSFNQQVQVIEKFRNKEFNILISTSVMEEGFDVCQCNLVINYNDLDSFKSYIQMKGRARKQYSTFNQMCSNEFRNEYLQKLGLYKKLNEFVKVWTQKLASKKMEKIKESYREKGGDQLNQYFDYILIQDTGALVSTYGAQDLLKEFCDSLYLSEPQIYFSSRKEASYSFKTYKILNTDKFCCIIILPLLFKKFFYLIGPEIVMAIDQKNAKRASCFHVIKDLLRQGLIDQNLKPKHRAQFRYLINDYDEQSFIHFLSEDYNILMQNQVISIFNDENPLSLIKYKDYYRQIVYENMIYQGDDESSHYYLYQITYKNQLNPFGILHHNKDLQNFSDENFQIKLIKDDFDIETDVYKTILLKYYYFFICCNLGYLDIFFDEINYFVQNQSQRHTIIVLLDQLDINIHKQSQFIQLIDQFDQSLDYFSLIDDVEIEKFNQILEFLDQIRMQLNILQFQKQIWQAQQSVLSYVQQFPEINIKFGQNNSIFEDQKILQIEVEKDQFINPDQLKNILNQKQSHKQFLSGQILYKLLVVIDIFSKHKDLVMIREFYNEKKFKSQSQFIKVKMNLKLNIYKYIKMQDIKQYYLGLQLKQKQQIEDKNDLNPKKNIPIPADFKQISKFEILFFTYSLIDSIYTQNNKINNVAIFLNYVEIIDFNLIQQLKNIFQDLDLERYNKIKNIQNNLNYIFNFKQLIVQALTHESYRLVNQPFNIDVTSIFMDSENEVQSKLFSENIDDINQIEPFHFSFQRLSFVGRGIYKFMLFQFLKNRENYFVEFMILKSKCVLNWIFYQFQMDYYLLLNHEKFQNSMYFIKKQIFKKQINFEEIQQLFLRNQDIFQTCSNVFLAVIGAIFIDQNYNLDNTLKELNLILHDKFEIILNQLQNNVLYLINQWMNQQNLEFSWMKMKKFPFIDYKNKRIQEYKLIDIRDDCHITKFKNHVFHASNKEEVWIKFKEIVIDNNLESEDINIYNK